MSGSVHRRDGWRCEMTKGGIAVSTWRKKYGLYRLLEKLYCEKCSFPGVLTDECGWHWKDKVKRTYSMGIYLPKDIEASKTDLLSMHISGLKRYVSYSVPLGLAMSICLDKIYPELKESDLLVPIPKHLEEFKIDQEKDIRYNQAAELANVISSETDLNMKEILVKTKPHSQRGKSWEERTNLPEGLYLLRDNVDVRGKSILLIDDVRTSGGSATACAIELYAKGAPNVNLFVAGRDVTREWKGPKEE